MDQQHRYAALTALLDREGAVRCDDGVLPSRNAHAKYLYYTCSIVVGYWGKDVAEKQHQEYSKVISSETRRSLTARVTWILCICIG
jgi:hypothetical protein